MNEIDREIGLVLLKRLWQRDLISEELCRAAGRSRLFDRRHFVGAAEAESVQAPEKAR